MSAPLGNQYAKGNKGGGRKGYEYEEKQLKTMRKIVTKGLNLTQKILNNEASAEDIVAHKNAQKIVLKAMDKLHANKQEAKMDIVSGGESTGVIFLPRRKQDEQK